MGGDLDAWLKENTKAARKVSEIRLWKIRRLTLFLTPGTSVFVLRHPQLKRLRFRRRDRLNQAKNLFRIRAIRLTHFESVTIYNGFISLFPLSAFRWFQHRMPR